MKVKNGLSLKVKISIMIVLILTFALLLNVFLNFSNFEESYTNMIYSRFFVIAKDLRNTAEYGLSLGLLLPESKNIQEVINGIVSEQKDIVSIAVFNDSGQVIFHTNPEEKNKEIPSKWVEGLESMDKEEVLKFTHNDTFVIALPLINTFNIKVGGLALSFSKSHIEIPVRGMLLYLFKYFLVFLVVFAVITFMGVSFFSRDILKSLVTMQSSLEDFLEGKHEGNERESESETDLQKEFAAFQEEGMEVIRKIEHTSEELRHVDKEESAK